MVRIVNVLKMRKSLDRLLEQVDAKGNQYVIEQGGRPPAAVVPVWQLKEWRERRDRFFAKIDAVRRKSRKAKPRAIERDVAAAGEIARRLKSGSGPQVAAMRRSRSSIVLPSRRSLPRSRPKMSHAPSSIGSTDTASRNRERKFVSVPPA